MIFMSSEETFKRINIVTVFKNLLLTSLQKYLLSVNEYFRILVIYFIGQMVVVDIVDSL